MDSRDYRSSNNLHIIDTVNQHYRSYIDNLKRYSSISSSGLFIRYYNISQFNSDYNKITKATFDRFDFNSVYYDVYDYTPTKLISPSIMSLQYQPTTSGYRFDNNSRIIIYTIDRPNVNDIVELAYPPHSSEHVWRVKSFNTNTTLAQNGFNMSELDLEYAPIIRNTSSTTPSNLLSSIKTTASNRKAFFTPFDRYLSSDTYVDMVNWIDKVNDLFDDSSSDYLFEFDPHLELYKFAQHPDPALADPLPVYSYRVNQIVYDLVSRQRDHARLFNNLKSPFGIKPGHDISGDSTISVTDQYTTNSIIDALTMPDIT